MAKSINVIELSGQKYDENWLKSVPLNIALSVLGNHHDRDQVRNAWKQANGKSVRNYAKPEAKPKAKATRSKAKTTK